MLAPSDDWATRCAAVIPCHNEAASIREIVLGVRRHLPNVFVVDDGSTDPTATLAVNAGAEVLRLPRNLGKGSALKAGWKLAQQRGYDWALTLDGDGQHLPNDIPALLNHAAATRADLVIGNRMTDARRMPWMRRQANRWMSRCLSRMSGVRLPDSQCGFRLVNLQAWAAIELNTHRFEIESELLLVFIAAGHRVAFAPIQTVYPPKCPSKIHPVSDTWRWLRWLVQASGLFCRRARQPAELSFLTCDTTLVPK